MSPRYLVLPATVAVAFALAGCGQVSALVQQGAAVASQAAGVASAAASAAADAGVNVSTSGSLPSGWPSDIPAPEGTITTSVSVNGGYSIIVQTSSEAAITSAVDKLKSAGYSLDGDFSSDGNHVQHLASSQWSVVITWGPDPSTSGAFVANYVVAKASS
ncbi:MAG: hypothetical protein CMH36_04490 [Microbacterium sp.]|uniref:Lipoprotein n=1 Tax=Microbacterium ginsengisoli TaxID=400772 RepID=A0A0F0LNW2_9MICO|nr:hypothetical protein [Microbacterium ginsengisoli]MAL06081.1 hypothetical protein [Microbacterium sp.]KJL34838.1 hypothetical protein RR49_02727 [Microbacterium ginsengisoli]KJL35077.1 hypothetical protein RR49_02974 [Microbacterium ginsengisoli]MBN9207646.1 hypothetical protein [Microbacterium ginsengisoli]HAN23927.1 hypothetical protein [Microbacterium ginsengisoli]